MFVKKTLLLKNTKLFLKLNTKFQHIHFSLNSFYEKFIHGEIRKGLCNAEAL